MTLSDVTAQIDSRLAELKEETARLEKARALLADSGNASSGRARTTTSTRSSGRPPGRPPGRRGGGRRKGGGTRAAQALDLVKARPGITIPELAGEMGIKQNYLYRVLPTLAEEGKVAKKDKGWHPANGASAEKAPAKTK